MEKKSIKSKRHIKMATRKAVEADGRRILSQPSNRSHAMTDVKRMYTFAKFPHKDIILKLHESGFFYPGNGDTTICHKCYAAVSDWKPNDDPGSFHELNCIYRKQELQMTGSTLTSLLDEPIEDITGEVPLSPTVLTSGSEGVPPTVHSASSRIGDNWSLQISGHSGNAEQSLDLSPSAVEVSVESNTSERCTAISQNTGVLHPVVNSASIHDQQSSLNATEVVLRTVDTCHYPTQVSDADVEMSENPPSSSVPGPSSYTRQTPRHNITFEESSVDPIVISDTEEQESPMQPDTEWASAFPYINRARCFYCGIGGHEWSPHENPWEVHAALYPNCEYLLQQKGLDYVSDVGSRQPQQPSLPISVSPRSPDSPRSPAEPLSPLLRRSSYTSSSPDDSTFSSLESNEITGQNMPNITIVGGHVFQWGQGGRETQPPRVVDPRQEEAKRKMLLETSLNSEIVLTAMEMGFEPPMIKRVIKRKIWRTDETYSSPSALLDDLLHPPADLDSDSDEDEANENATGYAIGGADEQEMGGSEESERRPPAAASSSENMDQKELDEKLREFEHEKRCKVCLDRDADVVFIPCGHLCTCVDCAQALRSCPMCRKRIQKSIKTYTS